MTQNAIDIIVDPIAPINVKGVANHKPKGLVLKKSSSNSREKDIGKPVGPTAFIRSKIDQSIQQESGNLKDRITTTNSAPCETIIFDIGVKVQDNAQIVNIDDVKSWELLTNKDTPYLGTGSLNIGSVEHDPKKNNVLLRGHDKDKVISQCTTYINTAVSSDTIVNIASRDSMPRSVAAVDDKETDSYVLNVVKKRMGNKFRKNSLYIVKTNVFRASDATAAQRLYEYIESFDKADYVSKSALKEAALIRKNVHELVCNRKGLDPVENKELHTNFPYTDTTLGILHVIYCIHLSDVPGYDHDTGQLFINNLDLCINIGLHQPPPLHPVHITYNNKLTYNPGYVSRCTPTVLTGYSYYVKSLVDQKPLYAVVSGNVISIEPQTYPVAIDTCNEHYDKNVIRIFRNNNLNDENIDHVFMQPEIEDIEIDEAIKSGIIYETYENAQNHLNKFDTSLALDISKSRSELAEYERKSVELRQQIEVSTNKYNYLLTEIKSNEEQLQLKSNIVKIEHDNKIVQETVKQDTLHAEINNSLKIHEQKMQSAVYSASADRSSGMFKVAAAGIGLAATGFTVMKAFQK